jgi:hypothetical protein
MGREYTSEQKKQRYQIPTCNQASRAVGLTQPNFKDRCDTELELASCGSSRE